MTRKRADSASYAVTATQAAYSGVMQPPAHIKINAAAMPFWEAIVLARAADTWNPVDLQHAANLARCQEHIERLSEEIEKEGDVLVNAKGTPVTNPKHSLMETLSRRAVALSRCIHVHAEATVGRSQDAAGKLATEKAARGSRKSSALSDLDALESGLLQ